MLGSDAGPASPVLAEIEAAMREGRAFVAWSDGVDCMVMSQQPGDPADAVLAAGGDYLSPGSHG